MKVRRDDDFLARFVPRRDDNMSALPNCGMNAPVKYFTTITKGKVSG